MKSKKMLASLLLATAPLAVTAQTSDTFQTPGGKTLVINHIKHASIHFDFEGYHVYVDPVANTVEPKTDVRLLPTANMILITHEHADHFDPLALPQMWTDGTLVAANPNVVALLHRGYELKNGDSLRYDGIAIRTVPAYNTTPGREKFHPKGRDNGYIIDFDGLRVYVAGDTEDIPEMAQLKDIDIAFLPCNQPYTMTVEQLVNAANTIKPRVLFPYHYSETPIGRVRMALANSGIDVRIRQYK